MRKVIFDCDNTMGIKNCDVDDGLTLLYLLGRQDIDLLGVTTTFGNSKIDIVHDNTLRMFDELKITNIPIYKGASSPQYRQSEAASYLANIVKKYPGEITLLGTGSLTNLLGAYELDNSFFTNLKEIVLMGGITEPLIINGKNLNELNFSCDSEASHRVLSSNTKVTVLTGHICLQALFGEKEYKRLMENSTINIYKYIKNKTIDWFEFIMDRFQIKGFYNWDIVAAVYITHTELFNENIKKIISTPKDLDKGYLIINSSQQSSYEVNIPTHIGDINRFNDAIFEAWKNVII